MYLPKFLLLLLVLPALALPQTTRHSPKKKKTSGFQITSPAFHGGGTIPEKFSCQGENISPQLNWKGAPAETKAFALVVHDPDAPHVGGFTHWVAYNIPANVSQIAENAPKQEQFPGGGMQGKNDDGKIGYTGPCPPSGTHRYYFYLYALNGELDLQPGATAQDLDKAMEGHVLGKAEMMGKFSKSLKFKKIIIQRTPRPEPVMKDVFF
jgi:Raf kinase inhibitor-like YbhB/YbcL family protein